jgi:transcriptional regulator with XRE-family HTH domain
VCGKGVGVKDRKPTVRGRELGAELKRLWEQVGLNGTKIAAHLGWSQGRISRLQSGKRVGSEVQVANALGFLGVVDDAEITRLTRICRDVHDRSWLRSHDGRSPDELRTLQFEERAATMIVEYAPQVLPDLLQTEDYTRALLYHAGLTPAALDRQVQARRQRHSLFARLRPPTLVFYLGEQALHTPIGDTRIRDDQLFRLTHLAALPHCTIRILPTPYSPAELLCEPFRLLIYPEFDPVIYVRNLTTSLFLEDPDDLTPYTALLNHLDQTALDPDQSRELLHRLAHRDGPPHDARDVAAITSPAAPQTQR